MLRILTLGLALAACSPALQNVQLVNRTPRTIAEIYVYPLGSANRGASRGSLAPDATLDVKLAPGNLEVLAISEKIRIDDRISETKQASQGFELKGPLQLLFHDSDQQPAGLEGRGTLGVAFRIDPPAPAPTDESPVE